MKNSSSDKLRVCFFGSYDRNYSRNKVLLKGLRLCNVETVEAHLDLTNMNIDKSEHLGTGAMLKRIFRKIKLVPVVFRSLPQIANCNVIFAAIPGHLDMPFAFLISRLLSKPLVFDSMWSLYGAFIGEFGLIPKTTLRSKVIKAFDNLVYKLADFIIFDTQLTRDLACKNFKIPIEKTRVLYLGADDEIYSYSGLKSEKKSLTIIYYGLFNPMHGLEFLIEAANILKKHKDINFVLIGKGQTYEATVQKTNAYKLDNVKFLPDVTEKNAKKYLDQGDIFLGFLKSTDAVKTAIPNKLFQGLALGKVILTAETPITLREFKHKNNIYLVKPDNSVALAKAIMELKNNPNLKLRIAKNGFNLFKNKYTPLAIGRELKHIFTNIIQ